MGGGYAHRLGCGHVAQSVMLAYMPTVMAARKGCLYLSIVDIKIGGHRRFRTDDFLLLHAVYQCTIGFITY